MAASDSLEIPLSGELKCVSEHFLRVRLEADSVIQLLFSINSLENNQFRCGKRNRFGFDSFDFAQHGWRIRDIKVCDNKNTKLIFQSVQNINLSSKYKFVARRPTRAVDFPSPRSRHESKRIEREAKHE